MVLYIHDIDELWNMVLPIEPFRDFVLLGVEDVEDVIFLLTPDSGKAISGLATLVDEVTAALPHRADLARRGSHVTDSPGILGRFLVGPLALAGILVVGLALLAAGIGQRFIALARRAGALAGLASLPTRSPERIPRRCSDGARMSRTCPDSRRQIITSLNMAIATARRVHRPAPGPANTEALRSGRRASETARFKRL
jgi:hypothetical protein